MNGALNFNRKAEISQRSFMKAKKNPSECLSIVFRLLQQWSLGNRNRGMGALGEEKLWLREDLTQYITSQYKITQMVPWGISWP